MNKNGTAGNDSHRRMLGVWDLQVSPLSLGGALILVEELQMQIWIHKTEIFDIAVVGDTSNALSQPPAGKHHGDPLMDVIHGLRGVGRCFSFSTMNDLHAFLRATPESYDTWPRIGDAGAVDHQYASTIFSQTFYRQHGFVPHLSCKDEFVRWADDFIRQRVLPNMPVAVHLKNNGRSQNCSNADVDAWHCFFSECGSSSNVRFILVGDDPLDDRIRKLKNVLVAREVGSDLVRDLALIQWSPVFMGMASGLCNMAIFGGNPYVIYKNPDHHREEMKRELGDDDRLPFATEFQRFLRVFETPDNLESEYSGLSACVNRKDWKKRIGGVHGV